MVMVALALSVVPGVFAVSTGSGIGVDIITEDFEPRVFMCESRAVLDDNTEPGRLPGNIWGVLTDYCLKHGEPVCTTTPVCQRDTIKQCIGKLHGSVGKIWDAIWGWEQDVSSYELEGIHLWERFHNYAFEGEQIVWDVLVWDKNGIEKIEDVFATIGDVQGAGNDIEVNCILDEVIYNHEGDTDDTEIYDRCNARELEEELDEFHDNTAALYKCILTVETPDSMYGEYWITVEATDLDGLSGTMDENEYWYLNPVVALSIDGDIAFEDVRPGTSSYSETVLVGNDADDGSGVLLDMFISGTDFYDSSSSGAKCPYTNQLGLDAFSYFATNGAYSSQLDHRGDDEEGYVSIGYGIGFNDPNPFYGDYEIMHTLPDLGPANALLYQPGNTLSPGSEMAVTFRLNLPEPCNGDFDSGQLFFWGEAI